MKRRTLAATVQTLIIDGEPTKRKKKLSTIQSYTELFWDKRLKEDVELGFKNECRADPTINHKDHHIAYQNRRLKEMYDMESDEVKAEVEENHNSIDLDAPDDEPFLLKPGEEFLPLDEQKRRSDLRKREQYVEFHEPAIKRV